MTNMASREFLLTAGVVLSMLCAVPIGLDMAFSVYALTLKETFNFTQSQVELTAVSGVAGGACSFLALISTGLLGLSFTFLSNWLLMSLLSGTLGLMAFYNQFFGEYPVFVYIAHFLMFTSDAMENVAVSRFIVEWSPRRHTGKLIGIYYAMTCLGKIVFAAMMDAFFWTNLAGFFFAISIVSFILFGSHYGVVYLLLRSKQGEYISMAEDETEAEHDQEKGSTKNMLKSPFFHLTFWPSAVSFSIMYATMNNITAIAASVGVVNPLDTTYLFPLCVFTSRIAEGVLFDRFASDAFGLFLIVISHISFLISMLLVMFWWNVTTLYVSTALLGIGIAAGLTITRSTLVNRFGRSQYGIITAMLSAVMATLQSLMLLFIGHSYDVEAKLRGSTNRFCIGSQCFYSSFVLMFILSGVMIVLLVINLGISLYTDYEQRVRRQNNTDNLSTLK